MTDRAPSAGAVPTLQIRAETPADIATITALTKAAFAPQAFSDGTEHDALDRLREDGDLTLSLVAVPGNWIIGHAAFSPARVDDHFDGWYGLGPISVMASHQRQGIGTALVQEGRIALEAKGAKGLILIGNPQVYAPMGFVSDGALTYRDLETRLVQYLAFFEERPSGTVTFAPALEV